MASVGLPKSAAAVSGAPMKMMRGSVMGDAEGRAKAVLEAQHEVSG